MKDSYNLDYHNLNDLLEACAERQISLSRRGDKLHIEAPQGAMTPEIRAALVAAKPEVMAYLLSEPEQPAPVDLWRIPLADYDDFLAEHRLRAVGSTSAGPNGEPTVYLVDAEKESAA